jgi:hypothetical protein
MSKREMAVRIPQQFCLLLRDGSYKAAVELGERHAALIRADRWRVGGMVLRALYVLCGYGHYRHFAHLEEGLEEAVRFVLHTLGGEEFVNAAPTFYEGLTPLGTAIKHWRATVVRTLIRASPALDLNLCVDSWILPLTLALSPTCYRFETLCALLDPDALHRIVVGKDTIAAIHAAEMSGTMTSQRSQILDTIMGARQAIDGPLRTAALQRTLGLTWPKELVAIVVSYLTLRTMSFQALTIPY